MTAKEAREFTLWNGIPKFIQDRIECNARLLSCNTIIYYNELKKYNIKDIQDILKMLGYSISDNGDYFKIKW